MDRKEGELMSKTITFVISYDDALRYIFNPEKRAEIANKNNYTIKQCDKELLGKK